MELVDSKDKKLNTSQVIMLWLKNNPDQPYPMEAMMAGILRELSDPSVKTKQIGNTVFEIIPGQNGQAFFKAFNADTGPNFVDNSKMFVVWAKNILGVKVLVTEFNDDSLLQLFKIISMNPPMPDMGYSVYKTKDGGHRVVLNLGA